MTTPAEIIDSARYDLNDYQSGIVWDDVELLNYLNRMIGTMDGVLASLDSDLVEEVEEDIDCVADQNYVDISSLNSGLWTRLRWVWIGQDLLEQTTVAQLRYKRIFRTGSQQPYYWALKDNQILFESDCASAYTTLVIMYSKKTATLASDGTMPYSGIFDETFREMLVLYAESKKNGSVSQINGMMSAIFMKKAMEATIERNFVPRPYTIDF